MDARFDIYLSGKLAEGVTPAAAAAAMAQLFKSTPEAMADMIDGKPRLLKRDVDQATAHKYRDALQRAGVLVAFRPFVRTPTEPAPVQPSQAAATTEATPGLSLAPAGGELLRPEERPAMAAVAVDTSHLRVEAVGELPQLEQMPPLPAPDTSHLTVAAAGADLAPPRDEAAPVALSAEMASMTLAPTGATLETLHTDLPAIDPDISGLSLAEPGDLLKPDERRRNTPPPPSTDHIRLA